MARQISDETRSKTASCPFSFQCLDDGNRDVCEVEYCLKENGCFLKSTKPNYCTYKGTFGYSYMCHCATRHELFRRYNI
jgi:hypothetical protein